MSPAHELLRRAVTVLLCGRTFREERSNRNVVDTSVTGYPLPAVNWSRRFAMQQYSHTQTPTYNTSDDHALNAAIAQSVVDQAAWEAVRGSGSVQQANALAGRRSAGETLSQKLWQDGSLSYTDVITDGLYDLYGDFPEVCEGPADFPTLENLRKVRTGAGDVREVVLVDHERDLGLLEVEEALSNAMAEATSQDAAARVQVIAQVVSDRFGGSFDSEASLEHFWQASSAAEKRRTRSAVVLLCRLDSGGMRHRALLFKILADHVKLPCKLIRGQVLCGADSAANVVVMVNGQEAAVDLVFEPGKLYNPEQFAALVQLRKTRLDSWRNHESVASIGSCVEASAVSASSTSSAGTLAGAGGSSNAICSAAGGADAPAAAGGAAGTSTTSAIPVPVQSSPSAPTLRPHVPVVPPVPVPNSYGSSLPTGGTVGPAPGGAGGWALGPGGQHAHGNPPAIAGSRVRFTITDLPKTGVGAAQQRTGKGGARPEPRPAVGAGGLAAAPAPAQPPLRQQQPVPVGPGSGFGVGPSQQQPSGVRLGGTAMPPSKARSMLDLSSTQHAAAAALAGATGGDSVTDGGHHACAGPTGGGGDLIRLDSEPLPDALALQLTLPEAGGPCGLPPPERSNTPTGHGVGQGISPRAPGGMHSRRQNSFDQNGWVKFSGSFTRPLWSHVVAGPSPLGQAAADRAAAATAATHATAATRPPLGQPAQGHGLGSQGIQGGAQQGQLPSVLELSSSLTSMCVSPSPDGPVGSHAGSASANQAPMQPSALGASGSSGQHAGAAPTAAAACSGGNGQGGAQPSSVMAASPFAHFQLPSGFSACLPPGNPAGGPDFGPNSADASMATGGTGGNTVPVASGQLGGPSGSTVPVNGIPSRPGSQNQLLQQQQQQQQQGKPQAPAPTQAQPQQQQQPQPKDTPSAAPSPFQAMQMGFGGCMAPSTMPSLAAAFPTMPGQAPVMQSQSQPTNPAGQGGVPAGGMAGQPAGAAGGAPLPKIGSYGFPHQPAQQQQQQPPSREIRGGSQDNGSRQCVHPNGASAGPTGGRSGGAFYTPPPKHVESAGGGGAGSKAPSPALSTPFTLTTSSVRSATPPGSVPAGNMPFGALSPFNVGEGGQAGNGGGAASGKDPAQFFADLSPFNTATGATSSGGSGDVRDQTPARRIPQQQQPIVEMPSSDNSRDATPRVSYTNLATEAQHAQHGGASGPSSSSGLVFGSAGTGAEYLTLDLARRQLGGAMGNSGRFGDSAQAAAAAAAVQHQHQLQMQAQAQAYGMAAAAAAAHGLPTSQHLAAIAYYTAAMQNNPYGLYLHQQQQQQAMAAAAGMPGAQGFMQGGGAWGHQSAYDPSSWASNPWAAQQQQQQQAHAQAQQVQQQFMFQAAYMQQQAQQHLMAGGFGAGHGGPGRRMPGMTTPTTVANSQLPEPSGTLSAPNSGNGLQLPLQQPQAQLQLPSTASHLALPSSQQPQLQQQQQHHQALNQQQQQQQQRAHQQPMVPQPQQQRLQQHPQHPQPGQQQQLPHQQGGAGPSSQGAPDGLRPMQAPVDLAHELTVPSQHRVAAAREAATAAAAGGPGGSQVGAPSGGGAGGSTGGADAGSSTDLSPLALQPSVSISMPLPPSYKDLEIEPSEVTFGPRIGIGSYGEVYKGTWRGTEVAIKKFLEQNLDPVTIREFRDEVMIMSKLRHPNIVLFMGAVTRSNQLAIVSQYVQRGSLFRLLHRTKVELDPRRRLGMALDIAKGMEYLHNCKPVLVHRDLKSPNLLVDRDWTVKVCDFGLSQVKNNTFLTAKSQGGSPAWMAPEILRGEPCDEKSDVFSFGVILYELITGKEPWEDLNPMQVVGAVGFSGRRMELPTDLDPEVTALIQSCWANSPRDRPSFTQILATMNTWSALRPTAAVLQQQEAAARARHQRAAS